MASLPRSNYFLIIILAFLLTGWARPDQPPAPALARSEQPAPLPIKTQPAPTSTPYPITVQPVVQTTQPAASLPQKAAVPHSGHPQKKIYLELSERELPKNQPAASPSLVPTDWKSLPVIPTLSERAQAIYQRGLALGNNPQAFSKVGDGEISAAWFLTSFDLGPQFYNLGPYNELNPVIDYFAGSFGRRGQAARRGFNTTRILDASLADPAVCESDETPLACEIRVNQPSFALVSLGTNQVWAPEVLEPELRQIIEILIDHGVVPVLSTKADNLEGDYRINGIIAALASEYGLPVWNFWAAVQPLPAHGLQEDFEHLTYGRNDFADPANLSKAWPVRNLTALQVLDALRTQCTGK